MRNKGDERELEQVERKTSHFTTVSVSFGLSAKLGMYLFTLMPAFNFFSSMSHLFRNTIKVVFCSNSDAQMACQRRKESRRRLIRGSSSRLSSKHEIGARNMMAFTLSKYGNHAVRFGSGRHKWVKLVV
jgi:hypothetical protein